MSIFEKIPTLFRKKESLPSSEDFSNIREKYVESQKTNLFADLLNNSDLVDFFEYTHNETIDNLHGELETFASCLAQFQLGLSLIHKRLGIKLKGSDIIYSPETVDDFAGPFAYVLKGSEIDKKYRGKFLVQLKEVYRIIHNEAEFQKVKDHWQIPNLTIEDLFLLTGVEEAAHRAYDQKSKKQEIIQNEEAVPSYHITDLEYRALFWKSKVIKKYLPQYVEPMRAFIQAQQSLRKEYIQG